MTLKYNKNNKYVTPLKKDRVHKLKETIEEFKKIKGFEHLLKVYRKQLKELEKENK